MDVEALGDGLDLAGVVEPGAERLAQPRSPPSGAARRAARARGSARSAASVVSPPWSSSSARWSSAATIGSPESRPSSMSACAARARARLCGARVSATDGPRAPGVPSSAASSCARRPGASGSGIHATVLGPSAAAIASPPRREARRSASGDSSASRPLPASPFSSSPFPPPPFAAGPPTTSAATVAGRGQPASRARSWTSSIATSAPGQQAGERAAAALALALGLRALLGVALDAVGADAVDVAEDRAREVGRACAGSWPAASPAATNRSHAIRAPRR